MAMAMQQCAPLRQRDEGETQSSGAMLAREELFDQVRILREVLRGVTKSHDQKLVAQ